MCPDCTAAQTEPHHAGLRASCEGCKVRALARINAARRMFPSVWMNEDTTEPGRDALTYYHEKWDEERDIGLGPAHDWASHGADAYGLMAVVAEDHMRSTGIKRDVPRRRGSPMAR